jgi:hypothetical protein
MVHSAQAYAFLLMQFIDNFEYSQKWVTDICFPFKSFVIFSTVTTESPQLLP